MRVTKRLTAKTGQVMDVIVLIGGIGFLVIVQGVQDRIDPSSATNIGARGDGNGQTGKRTIGWLCWARPDHGADDWRMDHHKGLTGCVISHRPGWVDMVPLDHPR